MSIGTNYTFEEDSILWEKFRRGDDTAYRFIYEKYASHLLTAGLRLTTDKELIKDCLHDVFVKIHKDKARLSLVNNIRLYLFRALRNEILNVLKKRERELDVFDDTIDALADTEQETAEELLIESETNSAIKHQIELALNSLSVRQREAIHYRYFEQMSIEEISVLMDMNYQSVQNLLQRSLKKIKDSLKK